MTSKAKEILERLGNEKIVVKGNWDGTIGREPQYNHLTTFKEHFKNEYETIKQSLERLERFEKDWDTISREHDLIFNRLKKENQELKEQRLSLSLQLQDYKLIKEITLPNVLEENEKYKKAIEILKDKVSFEIILNLCDDEEKEALKEVLGE